MTGVLAAGGPIIPNFGGASPHSCIRENGTFCWDWVRQNWSGILWPALRQHIELTLLAVAVGFAIAATLAVLAHRRGWLVTPVSVTSQILYTIPSLALFQILVAFTGLTVLTAEIALVSYTLLILFRNTLAGLRSVPPETRDAAEGMGMSRAQILWRVELPMAVPAIVAGLRVATVTVVSLATVAAFVINEGLGAPILNAVQQGVFTTEIFAAGILAALLAVTGDGLLVLLGRAVTPWARTRRPA